ncbi:MAG: pyridoxamine 5'-phosphate oxidase family protein [Actinomycetota bacterium]|nr:pyridoxamine 5'-phosphate oxidase family protein [Actinomycetota bacterium]
MTMSRPELTEEEAEFVRWARVARMATVGADGGLHNVPISPVLVDGRILIATDTKSKKVRNLESEPRTSLVFDEYSEMWDLLHGVVIEGTVRIIPEGAEFSSARAKLYEKYRQYEIDSPIEQGGSVILEVMPERILSWGF